MPLGGAWLKQYSAKFVLPKKLNILVVLSRPNKLGKLCVEVDKCAKEQPQCKKRQRNKFVSCQEGVVHAISRSCGAVCICQADQCVIEWLGDHSALEKTLPRDVWQFVCAFEASVRI